MSQLTSGSLSQSEEAENAPTKHKPKDFDSLCKELADNLETPVQAQQAPQVISPEGENLARRLSHVEAELSKTRDELSRLKDILIKNKVVAGRSLGLLKD
jgi:hypothetical protein